MMVALPNQSKLKPDEYVENSQLFLFTLLIPSVRIFSIWPKIVRGAKPLIDFNVNAFRHYIQFIDMHKSMLNFLKKVHQKVENA